MNNNFGFALLAAIASSLLLVGCHKAPATEAAAVGPEPKAAAAEDKADEEGVSLKPEEVETMGIATTAAQPMQSAAEVQGFGVVLPHETIATAVAEVRTAMAAERQSHAALERSHRLAGTPGAMPAETQEAAERQSIADQAALELARQKLSSSFGLNPPWKNSDHNAELRSLASGEAKLVHVTFPLGLLGDTDPGNIRLTRLDSAQGGKSWPSKTVWHAPADAAVPGRSYFAILNNTEIGEGDHLLAWTAVGAPETGVLVPASAAVISNGKFYCYVEEKAGTFVRTEIDPGRPTAEGYFVKDGISAGDKIVTHAAGQLLARETNPSKEPE
ncbi:MAG: hypothetical protein JSR66_10735 [Proteobacteria bacterium]|nr:hypothetical protein [Pseudomonadota bacterium]